VRVFRGLPVHPKRIERPSLSGSWNAYPLRSNSCRSRIYVPAQRVLAEATARGAIPYDIPDVEFTHEGERCSFDTFLRLYDIADPPLERLALIVRGADTSRHDLTPQCGGLFAISLGLSANFPDDHEMLDHGMVMYDALYSLSATGTRLDQASRGINQQCPPTSRQRACHLLSAL
jgi:hypothetical protein